jgi:zinc-ribbon domain
MYCVECGQQIPETAKFCAACGTQTTTALRRPVVHTEPSDADLTPSAAQPVVYRSESRRIIRRVVVTLVVCVGILTIIGYGLMHFGIIPGHRPGNTLSEDAASWDPFTHEEVATAIRAFDAKVDNEERTAKSKAVEKSRYDPKH